MIRGTTAEFKFNLPCEFNDLNYVKITFWQLDNAGTVSSPLPIIKYKNSCSYGVDPKELHVSLTQEETLRFSDQTKMFVQLRASANDGTVFASKQERFTVYPIYDDSILTPDDEETGE